MGGGGSNSPSYDSGKVEDTRNGFNPTVTNAKCPTPERASRITRKICVQGQEGRGVNKEGLGRYNDSEDLAKA